MREYITKEMQEEARFSTPSPFGPLGEDVYKRTYSRTKKDGTQEEWYETIARVVNGNCNYVPDVFIEKGEPEKLYKLLLEMQLVPAGRHLWATGIGAQNDYIVNCFSSDFTENFTDHFSFTFMRLMEGGGVGANYSNLFINSRGDKPWYPKSKVNLHLVCHPSHPDYNKYTDIDHDEIGEFPDHFWFDEQDWQKKEKRDSQTRGGLEPYQYDIKPSTKFTNLLSGKYSSNWDPGISNGEGPVYVRVEDSREGWAKSLVRLLELHMSDEDNDRDIVIDVSNVRPTGAILKGFGGTASGPDALMLLLYRVNRLLNLKVGQPLTSLDFMHLDHYIAQAVVSGGVRRSARMAMKYWKDTDIFDFIHCKEPIQFRGSDHWTTNISVVVDNKFFRALKRGDDHAEKVMDELVKALMNNGEPGVINASKCLEGESPGTVFFSTNPCGEIGFVRYPDLLAFDVCNLGHFNLSRLANPEEAARLITRFLIRATFAPVKDEKQRKNVDRNRRIGAGVLGYHSWLAKNKIKYSDAPTNESVRKFFRNLYEMVDHEAKKYCSQLRIPECIKKTTIAPTGSVGSMAGDTTGCQSVFAKFYIRRIRFSNTDPKLDKLRKDGYNVVPDCYAANTSVVEYVCVDQIFDEVKEVCKKDILLEGVSDAEAEERAKSEAIDLIEDQAELSLEDVLSTQRMLQKEYVDNSISITVNMDATKYSHDQIKTALKHYLPELKGVTLFPEKSMPLSPYQRLTWEELQEYEKNGYPIRRAAAQVECKGAVCPIK